MGRYVARIRFRGAATEIMDQVVAYVTSMGFRRTVFRGEVVWQKGGLLFHPQFLKIGLEDSQIHLEAWCKFMLFPGVYFGELRPAALGFLLAAQRVQLVVDGIEALVRGETIQQRKNRTFIIWTFVILAICVWSLVMNNLGVIRIPWFK